MKAWVDESIRTSGVLHPMYLLGASLTHEADQEGIAHALRCLAPSGKKLHWRDLGEGGQHDAVELIPSLEIEHVVVIAAPLEPGMKEERARGRCFERLLWELHQRGVEQVTFEARTAAQDKMDRRRIDGLRSRQLIPHDLRAEWIPGADEPLLWSPDLVLGAVGRARSQNLPLPASLSRLVTEISVQL